MTDKKILTIPNLMSFFRILLVPVFAVLFLRGVPVWPVVVLVLSGLTDLFDGLIARKFNQISDLGKMLDPVADKLTQIAVVACLTTVYKAPMLVLLVFYVVKEAAMLIGGAVLLKSRKVVPFAKWFGKAATFEFYLAMGIFLVFPAFLLERPEIVAVIVGVTILLMVFSLIMYAKSFFGAPGNKEKP